jgi:cytoskeleton protein RodZ
MNINDQNSEETISIADKPGTVLAEKRIEKGYTIEYIANKLHLRAYIIESIEANDYSRMAAAVFTKGYLRSYAKLLDIPPEPLIESFNSDYVGDRKPERTLWQSRKQTHRAEYAIRWVTALCALGVLIAVFVWWQANKDNEHQFQARIKQARNSKNTTEAEVRLTDLSKMRQLLHNELPEPLEKKDV